MRQPRYLRDRRHARLLTAARAGDAGSFQSLYRDVFAPVSRYIGRRIERPEDAEDLVSKVFHRFVENLDSIDARRGSVLGWLLAVAHNALVDHYRRRRVALPIEEIIEGLPGREANPLDSVLRGEGARQIRELLEELPAETRRMFALRFDQDLRYRDIALSLGLSEAAVKQRFSRGLRQLKARWVEQQARSRAEVDRAD